MIAAVSVLFLNILAYNRYLDRHTHPKNSPAHGTAWLPPALGNTNG